MSASACAIGRRYERTDNFAFGVSSCCTAVRREPWLPVCSARRRTRVGRATRIWPLLVCSTGFATTASATAPVWELLTAPAGDGSIAPESRARHAVDLWRDTLIVYGGEGEGGGGTMALLGDVWALNLTSYYNSGSEGVPWEQLNVGPGSTVLENNSIDNFMVERSGVASAVDPGSDTLFVFGGVVAETGVDGVTDGITYAVSDELWAFDLVGLVWQKMPSWLEGEGPSARQGATGSMYEESFLVWGGNNFNRNKDFGDLWSYNISNQSWTSSYSCGDAGRWAHTSTTVMAGSTASASWGDLLAFFGGASGTENALNKAGAFELTVDGNRDKHAFDGILDLEWSPSLSRAGHSMVSDSRGLLWMHGGRQPSSDSYPDVIVSDRTLVVSVASDDVFDPPAASSRRRSLRATEHSAAFSPFSCARGSCGDAAVADAVRPNAGVWDDRMLASSSAEEGRSFPGSSRWREYVSPDTSGDARSADGPGALMDHGAVIWKGRMILHGGRTSSNTGDVTSSIWSLAIDVDGTDMLSLLVEAEGDGGQSPLTLAWSVDGVVSLVFMLLALAWITKRTVHWALGKFHPTPAPSDLDLSGGLSGFMGAAPLSQTRPDGHHSGLSLTEIARLPVLRFPGPSRASASPADCVLRKGLPDLVSVGGRTATLSFDGDADVEVVSDRASFVAGADSAPTRISSSNVFEALVEESNRANAGVGTGRSTDETCAICLSDYVRGCLLRVMVPCGHRFHARCVDEWLRRQDVCPMCKVGISARAAAADDAPHRRREVGHGARTAMRAVTAATTAAASIGVGMHAERNGSAGLTGISRLFGRRSVTAPRLESAYSFEANRQSMLVADPPQRASESVLSVPAVARPEGSGGRTIGTQMRMNGGAVVQRESETPSGLAMTYYANPLFGHV